MSRRLACSRIRAPISGWRLISTHSCASSALGLCSTASAIAELADVVQDPGGADPLDARDLEPQLAGDLLGVAADRLGVARGGDVAQVERLGQQHRGGELLGAGALGVAQRLEHLERLRVVDDAAVAPEPLGGVERAVGGAHELGGVARLGPAAGRPRPTRRPGTGRSRTGRAPAAAGARRRRAPRASPAPGSTSANSSPPSRVGTSATPLTVRSTSAKRRSTSSPASWPSESLTRLKWSRSSTSSDSSPAEPSASRLASMPGSKPRRLRSPVSGSWAARWRRLSSWRADSTALIAWFANARSACSDSSEGSSAVLGVVHPHHARRAGRRGRAAARRASGGTRRSGPRPLLTDE